MGPMGMGMAPGMMGGPMGGMDAMRKPAIDPNAEIWVETVTKEGKLYYYNAKTRESAWTKPTGDGVQVFSQEQLEALAKGKKPAATGQAKPEGTDEAW